MVIVASLAYASLH